MLIAQLLHPLAGRVTLGLFLLIWGSAVAAGLFADPELLAFVKEGVVWSLFVLVPAAMATALTGLLLVRGREDSAIVARKRRRLRLIVGITVVLLLPATLAIDGLVQAGGYDPILFFGLQAVEIVAGLVTLVLMGINVRDGILARREAAAA